MKNLLIEPLKHFVVKVMSFLPNLLTSLVIIIAGLFIAWLLKTVVSKISGLLKLDVVSERIGVVQILHRGGIREPLSGIISRVIYWMVLISFIIIALGALKMPAVENLLERFLLYLPNVIVAGIITLLGYLLGNFLGRAALIASVNAGLSFSGLIGKFVKFTVFILAASMALELLGIGRNTVLIAFAVIFGGVVLALSIAYGLGGRDAAKGHIEKMLSQKQEDKDEITHI